MTFPDAEPGAPASTEIIFASDAMYMSLNGSGDFLGTGLPEGKKWLQLDLYASEHGELSDVAPFCSGNPTRILEDLEASIGFEEVGREEVRGVETTRYRGTVEGGPIAVWIGEDGLLRRFQYVEESTESGTTTVTAELYDFGADVDIEAPPADEVVSLDKLFSGGD